MNRFFGLEKEKKHESDEDSDSESKDGSRIWRADFPGGGYGSTVSVFVTDYDDLIVGADGKIACMNLMTGEKKWKNKMSKMSYEEPKTNGSSQMEDLPPNYSETDSFQEKPIVIACSKGKAIAIDPDTGDTLWTYDCPGGTYNLPVALIELLQQRIYLFLSMSIRPIIKSTTRRGNATASSTAASSSAAAVASSTF
ncbi:hypothetical protein BD560DRAFT_404238 [Blakeslea trispora]|nr:hypothetical protein BD560DRAFT_404238 [Blakeslea trispora]